MEIGLSVKSQGKVSVFLVFVSFIKALIHLVHKHINYTLSVLRPCGSDYTGSLAL